MESCENKSSIKKKRKIKDFSVNKPFSRRRKSIKSLNIYKKYSDNESNSEEIINTSFKKMNSDNGQPNKKNDELSNENILKIPESFQGTVHYISKYAPSDDEEIDVVNIDECLKFPNSPSSMIELNGDSNTKKSKPSDKTCPNGITPVPKIKNKIIKSIPTLAEGMQKLFSSVTRQSKNTSMKCKVTSDKDELKAIENVMDNKVENKTNKNYSVHASKNKSFCKTKTMLANNKKITNSYSVSKENEPVINFEADSDLGKEIQASFAKTVNDEKFTNLRTVKIILNRIDVDNYFQSKLLNSRKEISSSISNNSVNIISKINTSSKPNNKKNLKQTTMFQFYNTKSINESGLFHTTDFTEKSKNINKTVENSESIKEIPARIDEHVTAKLDNSVHTIKNSSYDLGNNSLPEASEVKASKLKFLYCNDCDYKTNKGKNRILRHIQRMHSNGVINVIKKCRKCDKMFQKSQNLKAHEAKCGLMHLQCPYCPLKTKYKDSMKKHVLKQHKNNFELKQFDDIFHKILNKGKKHQAKAVKLAFKGKDFPDLKQKEEVSKFEITMKNRISLYCTTCNESFKKDYNKKSLKMCPNCDELLQFQCLKCKKISKSYGLCFVHIKYKCEQLKSIFKCNDCNYTHYLKNKLKIHIEHRHTQINPENYVECPICSKGFKNRTYMKQHKLTCGKSKDSNQCQFCSYKTKYIYQFNKHMKQHAKHSKDVCVTPKLTNSPIKSVIAIKSNESKKVQVIAPNSIEQTNTGQKISNALKLATCLCLKCKATDPSATVKTIKCNKCEIPMVYNCKSCNRAYTKWHTFYSHLANKCATPSIYQCEHCDRQCTIKDNIRRHIFAEHMTEIDSNGCVKCPLCKKKYKGRSNMLRHKKRCQGIPNLKCKWCNIKCSLKHNLRIHMKRKHKNFSQTEIENALNNIVEKNTVIKREAKKNRILNPKSNEVAKNNLKVIPTNRNGFEIVSIIMNKQEILNTQHLIEVKCLGCSKSYTVDKKKKNHQFKCCAYCQAKNIFKCVQCSKEYLKLPSVRRHIKREHLLDPDQHVLHECNNCQKRFRFYESLKTHWNICINPITVKCDYCGFTTNTKKSVLIHIKRKHLGTSMEKNHECDKCTFKFFEKEALEKHMRSCTGVHKCYECGAKFRTKSRLMDHIQSKQIH